MAVYLDNAATSFPKPPTVLSAIDDYMAHNGANPGRGSYLKAKQAAEIVWETRQLLCELFSFDEPNNVIFTANVTEAINLAIRGFLNKGDHVITSSIEHNSVWRCLKHLEKEAGIFITKVPCTKEGFTDPDQVEAAICPNTRLIVFNHASNVFGTIQPIGQIGAIAKRYGVRLLVDCAQTAGSYPINFTKDNIDILAFTGHKGLLGPMGIGGLLIGQEIDLRPLRVGGTGRDSLSHFQPDYYPDKLEAGTANMLGIVGLRAALKFILAENIETIFNRKKELTRYALAQLSEIPAITVYGPKDAQKQVGVISINAVEICAADIAYVLDEIYNIAVRAGLHCSPCAHQLIETQQIGTVRISLGCFNTKEDIDLLITALKEILNK